MPHLLFALIACLACPTQAFRLLALGMSPAERDAAKTAVIHATGESWSVVDLGACSVGRLPNLLLEGVDADEHEWLLDTVRESLDGVSSSAYPERPVFVGACDVISEEGEMPPLKIAQAAAKSAICDHARRWQLVSPLRIQSTSKWSLDTVRMHVNTFIDGCLCLGQRDNNGAREDLSHVVALDGLVDEPLRASLLSLLHTPVWDPERGADPALWERGTFTDTTGETDVADPSNPVESDAAGSESSPAGGDAVRGVGYGLRPEALESICGEPPHGRTPSAILELQSRIAAYLNAVNAAAGVVVATSRMPLAVFGDCVTPVSWSRVMEHALTLSLVTPQPHASPVRPTRCL